MIGRLRGTLALVGAETAIIDVAGVGYEVAAAPRLLDRLETGAAATLAIETVVREDLIRLYGFADEAERQCFRLLQTVQGVGAKAALAVVHVLPPAALADAVAMGDAAAVARAQGVGKKIAERIVSELKGKTPALLGAMAADRPHETGPAVASTPATPANAPPGTDAALRADAVSALANLGYDAMAARAAVNRALTDDDAPELGDLVKRALKELAAA